MGKVYCVYILANTHSRTPVLYIGVTGNLARRVAQHKAGLGGFTARYNVTRLVYVERWSRPSAAIAREKQLKGWSRERKLGLIRSENPDLVEWVLG